MTGVQTCALPILFGIQVKLLSAVKSRRMVSPFMNLYCTEAPPVAVEYNVTGEPKGAVPDGDVTTLTADNAGVTVILSTGDVTVTPVFTSRAITNIDV